MKKRILIVDDEEDLTWSISKYFTRNDDRFETVCVHRGDEALEVLESERIDLVISDVRMPGADGMQLLEVVKRRYPGIPVIIISAYGTRETQAEFAANGAAYYLEKPFEIKLLRQMVYRALNLNSARPAA